MFKNVALFMLAFSLFALNGSEAKAETHYNCLNHDAYVDGTEVFLRSGPGTSYDIVDVTENHMHLVLTSLVGENFNSFTGIANKNTSLWSSSSNGPKIMQGETIVINKRYHGGRARNIAVYNGAEYNARFNDFQIVNDCSLWYEVTTELGKHGYISYKYVKPLSESVNFNKSINAGTKYTYYDSVKDLYYYY